MPNIDVTSSINSGHTPARHARAMPYLAEAEIDFATVLATKGSAIAANDIVHVMDIPAKTLVMGAGIEVITPTDAGTLTVDLALAELDEFVDGMDLSSTVAAGTMSTTAGGAADAASSQMATADDTLDMKIATQVDAAITTGKIRVWAILCDCSSTISAGIA